MNKSELKRIVQESTGLPASQASKVVDEIFDQIADATKRRERVSISGFGEFVAKARNSRQGRNPATKEVIKIREKTSVAFKPASALRDISGTDNPGPGIREDD